MGVPWLKLSLNPIVIANTGRPFNITTGFDNNRDGIFNDRPAFADAQTSGGLLVVGELPGYPVIGHTVAGSGIEIH